VVLQKTGGGGNFLNNFVKQFSVGSRPVSVALGDVNGDGALDIVTANAGSNDVSVLVGNGAGKFAKVAGSPFSIGSSPASVALGDLNQDGRLDIITADSASGAVSVLEGNGYGGFHNASGSPFNVGSGP